MDSVEAHKYSSANKKMLAKVIKCGCFYCGAIFNPQMISQWCEDQPDWTAICPYCGIDSVIGASAGYPITKESLAEMNQVWFH